jgi:hypothetical protein
MITLANTRNVNVNGRIENVEIGVIGSVEIVWT